MSDRIGDFQVPFGNPQSRIVHLLTWVPKIPQQELFADTLDAEKHIRSLRWLRETFPSIDTHFIFDFFNRREPIRNENGERRTLYEMYLQSLSFEAHAELVLDLISTISSPDKKGLLILWGEHNRKFFCFYDDSVISNDTEWTILRLPHPEYIFRWAKDPDIPAIRERLERHASLFELNVNTQH